MFVSTAFFFKLHYHHLLCGVKIFEFVFGFLIEIPLGDGLEEGVVLFVGIGVGIEEAGLAFGQSLEDRVVADPGIALLGEDCPAV